MCVSIDLTCSKKDLQENGLEKESRIMMKTYENMKIMQLQCNFEQDLNKIKLANAENMPVLRDMCQQSIPTVRNES